MEGLLSPLTQASTCVISHNRILGCIALSRYWNAIEVSVRGDALERVRRSRTSGKRTKVADGASRDLAQLDLLHAGQVGPVGARADTQFRNFRQRSSSRNRQH